MKLNERRRQILTTIASSPRSAQHFTHGNLERITSPVIMEKWLSEMADAGYLFETNGVYSITQKGCHALNSKCSVETRPITWNKSVYVTGDGDMAGTQYQREGSDHAHIQSIGLKC